MKQADLFASLPAPRVRVCFCCLNGSTADASSDDNSLRSMMRFARILGAQSFHPPDAVTVDACGRRKLDCITSGCLHYRYVLRRGDLTVVNLYGFQSKDPAELAALATDALRIGPGNDAAIEKAAAGNDVMVAGWGSSLPPGGEERARRVLAMLAAHGPVYCLGRNADGQPKHPLYLASSTPLVLLAPRRGAAAEIARSA